LLFALAQVCDKAADGRAIWWAKVISYAWVVLAQDVG
jgi:hypothetical protein